SDGITPPGLFEPQVVAMATTKEDVVFIVDLKLQQGKLLAWPSPRPVDYLLTAQFVGFHRRTRGEIAIGIQRKYLTKTALAGSPMHLLGVKGAVVDHGQLHVVGHLDFPDQGCGQVIEAAILPPLLLTIALRVVALAGQRQTPAFVR